MNDHDKMMLDKTNKALTPQPSAVPVKRKPKPPHARRIKLMRAVALRQHTFHDETRHAYDSEGNQIL